MLTLEEVLDFLENEFPQIQFEIKEYLGDISVVHENKDMIYRFYVSQTNNLNLWENGYFINYHYMTPNRSSGGGCGLRDLLCLKNRIEVDIHNYEEITIEQLELF